MRRSIFINKSKGGERKLYNGRQRYGVFDKEWWKGEKERGANERGITDPIIYTSYTCTSFVKRFRLLMF